jgi:uncharacterized membrane protein
MIRLGLRGRQWLKASHLIFAAEWLGGAVSLLLLNAMMRADDGRVLHGIDRSMKFIDDFVIIPGAIGSLMTGLVYGLLTDWGFFRHAWVTIKWIITAGAIVSGTFFLGPWLNSLPAASASLGLRALTDPVYAQNKLMCITFGAIQTAGLIFATLLSVLKPWKKRTAREIGRRPAESD